MTYLLELLYSLTSEKTKSKTSAHIQASTIIWFIQLGHKPFRAGRWGREKADAFNCVFNFDLCNAEITEAWNNFPDIWHRHGLGRLSLPEVLHHLHSENVEKNEVN